MMGARSECASSACLGSQDHRQRGAIAEGRYYSAPLLGVLAIEQDL
jgi:hypothetical protein